MPNASAADFFGEGTYGSQAPTTTKRDWTTHPPLTNAELQQYLKETQGALYAAPVTGPTGNYEDRAKAAFTHGNIGGAGGAYNAGNAATRAGYDQAHANNQGLGWGDVAKAVGTGLRWTVDPVGAAIGAYSGVPALEAITSPVGAITAVGTGQVPTNLHDLKGSPDPSNPSALITGGPPTPGGDTVPTGPGAPATPPVDAGTGGTTTPPADPNASAPPAGTSDTVSDLLKGVNTYQGDIYNLSQDNTGLSVAEAQLKKATALANAQSRQATEQSQRSALGMARGVRNRGDRALAERQAIGEAAYIGQEQARTDALRRATTEGDLSILRATESDNDRRFKLEALQAAGALGLNTAALEVDINKVNMQDATERMKIQLGYAELDANKARDIMNFTRDMASIQFEYDKLSVDDQNEADRLLMQKYGIDQTTYLGLKQIKEQGKFRWDQVLTAFIGGAAQGGTGAIAMKAMSDERAKTNITDVSSTAKEFEDFMGALTANTYEYKDPEKHGLGVRFGFMAQDLDDTELGKHIVHERADGYKEIEIAPLALATASGLALVYERLKHLESAVRS